MSPRVSPKHARPRNRALQSAARQLAARQGISYQQALEQLAANLRPWSAQVALTFRYHTNDGPFPHSSSPGYSADQVLGQIVAHARDVLGDHGELRVIDFDADPGDDTIYTPDIVLGFTAADAEDAHRALEALLEALDGAFDNAVSFEELLDGGEPHEVAHFNTRLTYRYRDEHNYKCTTSLVLAGEPTPATLRELRGGLSEGEWFIPSQVGLEDIQDALQQFDSPHSIAEYEAEPSLDPDHPWHELEPTIGEDLELTAEPTTTKAMSFAQLARAIAEHDWDDTISVRRPRAD
jgi:hypothetical protein